MIGITIEHVQAIDRAQTHGGHQAIERLTAETAHQAIHFSSQDRTLVGALPRSWRITPSFEEESKWIPEIKNPQAS